MLTSQATDRPLSLSEHIGLFIHRAICGPCRVYRRQISTLRRGAAGLRETARHDTNLESDAKERIRAALRKAQHDDAKEVSNDE